MGQYGIVWNRGVVEVAGIEPENSLVNSKPCTVWCPYRCPSVQINGVTNRKRCWSWGKIFRQYRAILAQLRTGPETKYCDYSCGYHWRHEQRKTTTGTFH